MDGIISVCDVDFLWDRLLDDEKAAHENSVNAIVRQLLAAYLRSIAPGGFYDVLEAYRERAYDPKADRESLRSYENMSLRIGRGRNYINEKRNQWYVARLRAYPRADEVDAIAAFLALNSFERLRLHFLAGHPLREGEGGGERILFYHIWKSLPPARQRGIYADYPNEMARVTPPRGTRATQPDFWDAVKREMDKRGVKVIHFIAALGIDTKTWYSRVGKRPGRDMAIMVCLLLRVDAHTAIYMLSLAGYLLDPSVRMNQRPLPYDICIRFCFEKVGALPLMEVPSAVNAYLRECRHQPLFKEPDAAT